MRIVILLLILFSCGFGFAQDAEPARYDGAAQYFLGDRDQILININVWGYVMKPGQYLVPRQTDLVALISFAGGPREGADLSDVMIVRGGTQNKKNHHVGRNGTNGKAPILKIDVENNLKTGQLHKIPVLQAGDTVMITETGGSKFQKVLGLNSVLSVIAATASIALIIDRLNN